MNITFVAANDAIRRPEGATHALWDRNQGISRAAEPLPGTTGSAEAAGLATKPDYCKRLLPPQTDSGAGSGTYVWGIGRRRTARHA